MSQNFFHGIRTNISDSLVRAFNIGSPSVIAVVGTAGKGPVNEPTLLTSRTAAVSTFGEDIGDGFDLPKLLEDIYSQVDAQVVAINVADPTSTDNVANEEVSLDSLGSASLANRYVSNVTLGTAIKATLQFNSSDEITLPAGITSVDAVKSSDGNTTFADTTDYTVASNVITRVGAGGIAANAQVIVEYTATLVADTDYTVNEELGTITRISGGNIVALATFTVTSYDKVSSTVLEADIIGTVTAGGDKEGAEAILDASGLLNVEPSLICAPNWSYQPVVAGRNAVLVKLQEIAAKIGAIVITNTPNSTPVDSVQFASDNANEDTFFVDGFERVTIDGISTVYATAAKIAGQIARNDSDNGIQSSPSNKVIRNFQAVDKPRTHRFVAFNGNGEASETNFLNENNVATIISENGFRLFGNYLGVTSPSQLRFINVKRVVNFINKNIAFNLRGDIDEIINTGNLNNLEDRILSFLRTQEAADVLIRGASDVFIDPAENTPDSLINGEVFVKVCIAVGSPLQTLNIGTKIVNGYVADVQEVN